MKTENTSLTETEEMLLEKYFDNEASFFERVSAKRLVACRPDARRYLQSLQTTQGLVQGTLPEISPSLWFRISARLHAEEKGALLLGKRNFSDKTSLIGSMLPSRVLRGGFAAALAAAALFIVLPKQAQQLSAPQLAGSSAPISIQRSVPIAAPVSVGVDWMRSDGRLQVMHEPSDRAPMIFVKRRYKRVGPVYQTERNSQGIIMKNSNAPRGLSVNNER